MKVSPQYSTADVTPQPIRELVKNMDVMEGHAGDSKHPLVHKADLVTWYRNVEPAGQNAVEFNRCSDWCRDTGATPNVPISRGFSPGITLTLALDVPGYPEVRVLFMSPIYAEAEAEGAQFDLREIISPMAMLRPHQLIRIDFDWQHHYARLVTTDFDHSQWAFHVPIN